MLHGYTEGLTQISAPGIPCALRQTCRLSGLATKDPRLVRQSRPHRQPADQDGVCYFSTALFVLAKSDYGGVRAARAHDYPPKS